MKFQNEIDFECSQNYILSNPRLPESEKNQTEMVRNAISALTDHFVLATSGTTGRIKWTALSKAALLHSAQAVNEHLQSDQQDIWLNPLPTFHVGGLGILARAYLSHAKMHFYQNPSKWDVQSFYQQLVDTKATLTSLVPAQIFDLVSANLIAPELLRAIIVGGGALSPNLYEKAIALKWKVLPSYGMTESASQIATANLNISESYPVGLQPLKHVKLDTTPDGFLKLQSPSLLTAYVEVDNGECYLVDPKQAGWLVTEDKVQFHGDQITSISRGSNFVKIGGESVDLLRLERVLEEVKLALGFSGDCAVIPMPDSRLEHEIHFVIDEARQSHAQSIADTFNSKVNAFERIRKTHVISKIPRSALQKVLRKELYQLLIPDCPLISFR